MSNNHIKNSIEFLLFSYFSLDLKDALNFDKALDAAIKKAYEDATNQGAYNTLFKKPDEKNIGEIENFKNLKKASSDAYIESEKQIYDCIACLLQDENTDYDKWHDYLCQIIQAIYIKKLKLYGADSWFTYGNAQKWINMTMKYLYIIAGCFEILTESEKVIIDKKWKLINNIYGTFHAPADSYIIKALWNENLDKKESALKYINKFNNNGKLGKYSGNKYTPWSKWEFKDYICFKTAVLSAKPDNKSSIEWECEAWIEQAKKDKEV